jgi:hypothetical protein
LDGHRELERQPALNQLSARGAPKRPLIGGAGDPVGPSALFRLPRHHVEEASGRPHGCRGLSKGSLRVLVVGVSPSSDRVQMAAAFAFAGVDAAAYAGAVALLVVVTRRRMAQRA